MKLYVDDVRPCPEGWALARTFEEVLDLLSGGHVTQLDLDWNLGQGRERTGLAVLAWLDVAVKARRVPLPEISVHTADPGARREMLAIIDRMRKDRAE